ncbi:MAG: 3-methyl-2-oxobutanoate dehydrogenase subunit VorB [Bacillota bacterium]|nr:3-methyl-2-oxobutanoate dehydrogenase subunit VorB [Bacillota bacterium]
MSEKYLMKGNESLAEAAIMAGCRYFFGYPITPQTELAAYMSKRMPKVGGTFLQAESEIAAINMVIGASSAGKRVMTSSSSPGVSLKSEGISYLAGMDLPAVIVNIQRGGPGLGGIQPAQSDYFQATKANGHGDFRVLVFSPSTVQEMVSLTFDAFDLSDLYRMPAMILGDGILGQMMEPVEFSAKGRTDLPPKDWAATGTGEKRKRNIVNSLYLNPDELEIKNFERFKRYENIKENEQRCEELLTEDADIIVVAFGAAARIAKNAIHAARAKGIKAGLIRPITLWPFPEKALANRAKTAKAFLTAELNMGQMIYDVKLAIECRRPVTLVNRTGGMVFTPDEILAGIERAQGGID